MATGLGFVLYAATRYSRYDMGRML